MSLLSSKDTSSKSELDVDVFIEKLHKASRPQLIVRPVNYIVSAPVTPPCLSDEDGHREQVFGVPLSNIPRLLSRVPLVVKETIQSLLDLKGHLTEGIFRMSTSHSLLQEVKRKYNKGQQVNFNIFSDPHLPACCLKMFLRELPESVFTSALLPEFNKLMTTPPEGHLKLLQELIVQLPEINQTVIYELFSLLKVVVFHQTVNRMHERSLSIIFLPSLGIGTDLFSMLLNCLDKLFTGNTVTSCHSEGRMLHDPRVACRASTLVLSSSDSIPSLSVVNDSVVSPHPSSFSLSPLTSGPAITFNQNILKPPSAPLPTIPTLSAIALSLRKQTTTPMPKVHVYSKLRADLNSQQKPIPTSNLSTKAPYALPTSSKMTITANVPTTQFDHLNANNTQLNQNTTSMNKNMKTTLLTTINETPNSVNIPSEDTNCDESNHYQTTTTTTTTSASNTTKHSTTTLNNENEWTDNH